MGIIAHISEILTIQRQYIKGQQSTDREQVNLRTVINDSIAMILPSLTKKDIEINMDIPLKLPMIKGDKTRLMQVFLNVFKNAAESIASFESSSKKISIVVIPLNNQLVVNITDTGKGFDAHIAENLFSRGFTSKDSGTGLGLINCKSIIESHNGQFEIKSDGFEKGAMVTITLKI
jgi:signal transduction histidine kinase